MIGSSEEIGETRREDFSCGGEKALIRNGAQVKVGFYKEGWGLKLALGEGRAVAVCTNTYKRNDLSVLVWRVWSKEGKRGTQ